MFIPLIRTSFDRSTVTVSQLAIFEYTEAYGLARLSTSVPWHTKKYRAYGCGCCCCCLLLLLDFCYRYKKCVAKTSAKCMTKCRKVAFFLIDDLISLLLGSRSGVFCSDGVKNRTQLAKTLKLKPISNENGAEAFNELRAALFATVSQSSCRALARRSFEHLHSLDSLLSWRWGDFTHTIHGTGIFTKIWLFQW